MATNLINRREAATLSGIAESTIKKAVDKRVVPARKRGSRSYIDVGDVAVLVVLGQLTDTGLIIKYKRQVRAWLLAADPAAELELTPALVIRRSSEVDEARRRAERYVALRDKWIVSDPKVKGGDPVIRGSRVSVHTLARRLAEGEGAEVLEEDFPHIPAEAREVAVQYARANPRRGRPKRAAA